MLLAVVSEDELLADDAVRAVFVTSPTGTHREVVVAAAETGMAIFCEKPVSLDLGEVDGALAAVADAGVPFQIGLAFG